MANNKNNQPDEAEFITLEYDDGTVVECEIMGIFDVDGKDYIALIPDDGSDDVYIYAYEEKENDEFEILDIEDDALFERVAAEFDAIMADEE